MKCAIGEVDGDQWEEYCHKLLRLRHQDDDYQKVPSKYGGDLGIEGFTRSGIVYQCYCPESLSSEDTLYDDQRDKITRDIRKLKLNEDEIDKLVGHVEIIKWIFLTPTYDDKKLIHHCHKKRKKVIKWELSFIGDDFDVVIKTDGDFTDEIQTLVGGNENYLISYDVEDINTEEIKSLEEGDEVFTDELRRKIDKLSNEDEQKERLVRRNLEAYIRGQNILEDTQAKYPDQYERIIKVKNAKEKEIELDVEYRGPIELEYLSEKMKNYNQELRDEFRNTIDPGTIKLLSQEAVSDWLIRCPIDIS